jgi:GTP-binding protein HflX
MNFADQFFYRREITPVVAVFPYAHHPSFGEWKEEFLGLLRSALFEPVAELPLNVREPHPGTYFRKGNLDRILQALRKSGAMGVAVDLSLTPVQERELSEFLKVRVLDRTAVILTIFGRRAHTRVSEIQVKLAQYRYLLPRLKGMWQHFDRAGASPGVRAGMGEQQIEVDRRVLKRQIQKLEQDLERQMMTRELHRRHRRRRGPVQVAVVGYTNVGKSSLIQALTKKELFVRDMPFATLDPLARKAMISGREVIFIDTVGFVRDLPPGIVEAFRSTLEEVLEADLLLHVADLSSSDPKAQLQTAEKILSGIGASSIPTLYVLNKADLVPEVVLREKLLDLTSFNPQVVVSVTCREGLQAILDWITHHLTVNLKTPSYLSASLGGEGS